MKIALGMSGGVDSSLSAHLLKEAGHEVTGVFLQCWRAPGCRADADRKDALAVALDLGIPFESLDFIEAYRDQVVERFFEDYRLGLTPNPDVWCNTAIKFGLFYDWAIAQGFDAVATGHYAQVGEQDDLKVLLRGADEKKDQTYFLYKTRQEQLAHIVFPIGHLQKSQVRAEAMTRNIPVATKPDSQGICFIGDINVRDFLKEHLGEKPGDVLDIEGNVIGKHQGVWFYTIGQRHGFELFAKIRTQSNEWKHVLPPMYVIAKDAESNTITVGYGVETTSDTAKVEDVFWRDSSFVPDTSQKPFDLKVRIRHGGQLYPAQFTWTDQAKNRAKIRFTDKIKGLAPGQAAVFYGGAGDEVCWGGGVLENIVRK